MNISIPPYSILQAVTVPASDCYPDPDICLPLSSNHNLKFFTTITGIDYDMWMTISGGDIYELVPFLAVVPPDFNCTPSPVYVANPDVNGTLGPGMIPLVTFIRAEATQFTLSGSGSSCEAYFSSGDKIDFDTLHLNDNVGWASSHTNYAPAPGECFKLAIVVEVRYEHEHEPTRIYFRQILGCIGSFVRTLPGCYTSTITYSNPTDSFGFRYAVLDERDNPMHVENKMELPFLLRDPVMNDDTKVYTRSDGTIIKLYERKEEQYILETDRMPYTWLKALDVALSHDSVKIDSTTTQAFDRVNTARYFQKKENFETEYSKGPFSAFGKGNCKLLNAQPVHLYNNNCG